MLGFSEGTKATFLLGTFTYGIATVGTIVSFLMYSKAFVQPIGNVSQQLNIIALALAGATRIFEIIDAPAETDDGYVELVNAKEDENEGKEELPAPTIAEQTEWALKFSEALITEKGERVAIMELRGLIPHFFNGFPGYKKIRAEISVNIKTKEDLFRILNGILNRNRL